MADIFREFDDINDEEQPKPKRNVGGTKTPTKIPGLVLISEDVATNEGTHYLDRLYATYNDLVKVLGKPNRGKSGDDKVDFEWAFIYKGHLGYIYDWKEAEAPDVNPNDTYEWHIGGRNNSGVWTSDLEDDIFDALKTIENDEAKDEGKCGWN